MRHLLLNDICLCLECCLRMCLNEECWLLTCLYMITNLITNYRYVIKIFLYRLKICLQIQSKLILIRKGNKTISYYINAIFTNTLKVDFYSVKFSNRFIFQDILTRTVPYSTLLTTTTCERSTSYLRTLAMKLLNVIGSEFLSVFMLH